nr:T9SS type A sorting domain-containing protein [Chitinophagaceae bacterium]
TGGGFADRVEVRLSENGASTSVGATESSVGDYTNLLFTINPTLDPSGYPDVWTQYTATVSGLAAPVMGRLAFRYYVTDAGPLGSNSDYIGIDDVKYVATGGAAQGIWTGPAGTMFTDATAATAYTGTPATTIYVQPTVSSNYQVMFTTPTPCTSATTTVPVNVVEPVTNIADPSDDAACVGTAASFSSNSADGGPYTRQWEVSTDGGLTWSNVSGANGTTLTVSDVEESMNNYLYRCRYDAPPCAGSAYSNAAKLTVNPLPVVTLTASDLELTPGQTSTITGISSPAAISWSWTLDGSPISGGSNTQVADIDLIGTYQATVVDNQTPGCTGVSNELTIGTEASDRLWIYPNPTTGEFQVRLYSNLAISEKRKVTIFNSIGQEIMSKTFSLINTTPHYLKMDFDLSNMAKGVYVVKVAHEYTKKIVSGLVVVQ